MRGAFRVSQSFFYLFFILVWTYIYLFLDMDDFFRRSLDCDFTLSCELQFSITVLKATSLFHFWTTIFVPSFLYDPVLTCSLFGDYKFQ